VLCARLRQKEQARDGLDLRDVVAMHS